MNEPARPSSSLSTALLLVLALSTPPGVAAGEELFWTERDSKAIAGAALDGSDPGFLVHPVVNDPSGIALDLAGGRMYFADAQERTRCGPDPRNTNAGHRKENVRFRQVRSAPVP